MQVSIIYYRKLHTDFSLVLKVVTWDDLERVMTAISRDFT